MRRGIIVKVGDAVQLRILHSGVDAWNEWRRNQPYLAVDLSGLSLRHLDLRGAFLANAILSSTNLTGVNLSDADLSGANLSKSKLEGTHSDGATLSWADLTFVIARPAPTRRERDTGPRLIPPEPTQERRLRATTFDRATMRYSRLQGGTFRDVSFRGANLEGAFLEHATFDGADFEGAALGAAEIGKTNFRATNIHAASNLATTFHTGPSALDFDTLRDAAGRLPDRFLRGVGFSQLEIAFTQLYNRKLTDEEAISVLYHMASTREHRPIQKRMIFISYAHADSAFVELLETALAGKGFRCWRDVHDFVSGRIEKQIDRAITLNEIVLILLCHFPLGS